MARLLVCSLAVALAVIIQSPINCKTQFSIGIEHDMSKPTYGLQQPTSSQIHYDDKSGLSLKGTIGDLLGPPIKIANGLNNVIQGGNMAGVGHSLRSGGALLGLDAKLLEAAGGAQLVKGGVLLGGAAAKNAAAASIAGPKGQKISSIIEVPVRVVAVKDLAAGKALHSLGQAKATQAQAADAKGQSLVSAGNALKSQGVSQVVQGATEGIQGVGNLVQKASENVNSAIKYLPLIIEMQQQQTGEATKSGGHQEHTHEDQHQHQLKSAPYQLGAGGGSSGLTGGSLFGGLGSLLTPFNPSDPLGLVAALGGGGAGGATTGGHLGAGPGRSPFGNLLGAGGANPVYAAVVNSSHPLTSLLMSPGMNPLLMPLAGGPLGQSLSSKHSAGAHESAISHSNNGQTASYSYSLFPGVRVSETVSNQLPGKASFQQQQQQQQQQHSQKS